ncbi:oxygen-independent coproporphyrinogen III oxidase [Rhodanobacter sp. BL-MT-08]
MNTPILEPTFDASLLSLYDTATPRYTSYPTAPHFREDFGNAALIEAISASNENPIPRPLSLYVHVPFCFSPCFYCGCMHVIGRNPAVADRYLRALLWEIERLAPCFDRDRPLIQLHLGGGTPNFLDLARLERLMHALEDNFTFAAPDSREFGIEIDPRFCDADYVQGLARLGFNRISIGIQDFDPAVQSAINRVHPIEKSRGVIQAAQRAQFRSINVDLIYGLPHQTPESFSATLEKVVGLQPTRIAVYGYAHLPALFKAQKQIRAEDLPDAAQRLQLFGVALEKLSAAGYFYIGMDHFARGDDDLVVAKLAGTLQRNFQGYSTCANCDILGVGVSAISRIDGTYSQNHRQLIDYYSAIEAGDLAVNRGVILTSDDVLRRDVIGRLMCHGELDREDIGRTYDIDFDNYFADELCRLTRYAQDGLVTLSTDRIALTPRGRLLVKNVAACFDAYTSYD